MESTEILVICTNADILQTILRLINTNEEWLGVGAETIEQTVETFQRGNFKLVLLGAGLPDQGEADVCEQLRAVKPDVTIINHFGGGSGLLFAEIKGALAGK